MPPGVTSQQSSEPKKPGCFAIGFGVFCCLWAIEFVVSLATVQGVTPVKRFVVIDQLPMDDPECVTIRKRKKTLGRIAVEHGWPAPGGMGGDNGTGYYEVVTHKPPWPCELRQAWVKDPIEPGTALEARSEDAVSATVTGMIGEARTLMLNYHRGSREGDLSPRRVGNEAPLLGYHILAVPWDAESGTPACIRPWRAFGPIGWPPKTAILVYLLFAAILCLKVLDCIGKANFAWMWSLLFYVALSIPIHESTRAYARSREACEPAAAAFAANAQRVGGVIYPLPARFLAGPWVPNSTALVVGSQFCALVVLLLATRLAFPAAVGVHYLLVPHPAERAVKRQPGKPITVDAPAFAAQLGRESVTHPPPKFVLKNKTRRIRELTNLFKAEREAAEAAVEHQRATRRGDH